MSNDPADKSKDQPTLTDAQLELISKTVASAVVTANKSVMEGIERSISSLKEGLQEPASEDKKEAEPFQVPDDLEALDNNKLFTLFRGMVKHELGEALAPVKENFTKSEAAQVQARISQEFAQLVQREPDVEYYIPELKVIMKSHPELTATQMFALAKESITPEREREIETQQTTAQAEKAAAEQAEKEAKAAEAKKKAESAMPPAETVDDILSTFAPTSQATGEETKGKKESMPLDEAAESALNETVGEHQQSLLNEQAA